MKRKALIQYSIKKLGGALIVILLVSFICFSFVGAKPIERSIRIRFGLFGWPDDYERIYNEIGFELGLLWEDGTEINFFIRYFQWLGIASDNKGNFSGLLQGDLGESWSFNNEFSLNDFLSLKILFTLIFSWLFFTIYSNVNYLHSISKLWSKKKKFHQIRKKASRKLVIIPTLLLGLLVSLLAWKIFNFDSEYVTEFPNEPFILDKYYYLFLIVPFLLVAIWSWMFSIRNNSINEEAILPTNYRKHLESFGFSKDLQMKLLARNIIVFQVHFTRDNLSMFYSVIMIIECMFNLPGLINSFLDFAKMRDYPAALSSIFIICLLLIIHRLFLDLILPYIDPGVLESKQKFQSGTLKTKWVLQF